MTKVKFKEDTELPEYFSLYFGKVSNNQLKIMEHTIGLSSHYGKKPYKNAKGKKLKRYIAYRNYYNASIKNDGYNDIMDLVNKGLMREYAKDFFELTLSGISYVSRANEINIYIGR